MQFLIVLAFTLSVSTAFSMQCKEVFRAAPASSPIEMRGGKGVPAKVKDFERALQTSRPEDYLTPDFVKKLETSVGRVQQSVRFYDAENNWQRLGMKFKADHSHDYLKGSGFPYAWRIMLMTGRFVFMNFVIMVDRDLNMAVVEDLQLRDPLNKSPRKHLSQIDYKGLPFKEFMKATRHVKGLLAAAGIQSLRARPQNFLVAQLYRRMVGLKPVANARNTYANLDRQIALGIYGPNELNEKLHDLSWVSRSHTDVNWANLADQDLIDLELRFEAPSGSARP